MSTQPHRDDASGIATRLVEIRRIAGEEVEHVSSDLDVVVMYPASDEGAWAHVRVRARDWLALAWRLVIGVNRDISESDLRRLVRARLQTYLITNPL